MTSHFVAFSSALWQVRNRLTSRSTGLRSHIHCVADVVGPEYPMVLAPNWGGGGGGQIPSERIAAYCSIAL